MHAVVVSFEHLSVDFLGCYGNTWVETPHFDRFAARGVTFDSCFASDPAWDTDSTGWSTLQIDADWLTLTSALRAAGVRISVCSERAEDDTVAARADRLEVVSGSDDAQASSAERPFRRLVDAASELAGEQLDGDQPSLLWVASRGVPSPWLPPAEVAGLYWDEFFEEREFALLLSSLSNRDDEIPKRPSSGEVERKLADMLPELSDAGLFRRDRTAEPREIADLSRAVYAAYVSAIDAWFGLLVERLEQSKATDLLLIVTGRAGDLFGVHPAIGTGCPPLIDPLLRVPLIVGGIGEEALGSRRRGLIGTHDLPATLSAWFGIDAATRFEDSFNLQPMIQGTEAVSGRERVFSGAAHLGWSVRTREFRCVVDAAPRDDDSPEDGWLFRKPDDMHDILNVANQNPDATIRLQSEIADHFRLERETAADEQ